MGEMSERSDFLLIVSSAKNISTREIRSFGIDFPCCVPEDQPVASLWLFMRQNAPDNSLDMIAAELRLPDSLGNMEVDLQLFGRKTEPVLFGGGESKGMVDYYFGHCFSAMVFSTAKCGADQFGALCGPLPEAVVMWNGDCATDLDACEALQVKAFSKAEGAVQLLQIDWRRGFWQGDSAEALLDAYSHEPGECIAMKTILTRVAS